MKGGLSILTILIFSSLSSQHFEGVIQFDMTFESNTEIYYSEQLMDHFGSSMKGFYKDGYYKEVTNAKRFSEKLWRHEENSEYIRHKKGSDSLFVRECAVPTLPYTYEVSFDVDTVLGHVCDMVRFTQGTSVRDYYYSSSISTDVNFYKNYSRSNKNTIVNIMKAVPLKIVLYYEDFNLTIEAVKIAYNTSLGIFG